MSTWVMGADVQLTMSLSALAVSTLLTLRVIFTVRLLTKIKSRRTPHRHRLSRYGEITDQLQAVADHV
ncbi:TPA: hypothetical protein U5341_004608 [Yersinia enterocolitica]|nr:hypothetical protein [Yersinia enterocolitica]